MKLAWRLTAPAVLVALLLASCGNGGEGNETTVAAAASTTEAETTVDMPTRAEYIAQVDAICADVQAEAAELQRQAQELRAQGDELPKAEFLARAASFWGEQIRVTESFREQLAQLDPPPGDEDRVGQFVESIDDGLAIAREIEATLEGGDDIAASTVEEYGRAVVRGNALAQAYGFEVCGRTG
jgi:hypothetical protein